MRSSPILLGVSVVALVLSSCWHNDASGFSLESPSTLTFALGDPIDGLTREELAAFERGKVIFQKRFKPSEGLGPFYNATSCASCHSTPTVGGTSGLYRNFYIAVYGTGNNQSTAIAPFLSQVVPSYGTGDEHPSASFTLEGGRPVIPDEVFGLPVVSAQRNAIPIFGVGLFELISDNTILENYDPLDANGDGVSGRHNLQLGHVGRFGLKAQANNIELFTRGPLQFQMGITTEAFEGEDGLISLCRSAVQASSDPNNPTVDNDGVADPELSRDDLGDLIAFTRFLAPPSKKPFNEAAERGEELFEQIGCTICHIPSLPSSRGPVEAYTDLLIHRMGSDLEDGIDFGGNGFTGTEFRTQPLWGVSMSAPYMHDGRAEDLEAAILLHRGEAAGMRNSFRALTDEEQDDIITFLEHL